MAQCQMQVEGVWADLGVAQRHVPLAPWRVGPEQRDDRCGEQQEPPDGLLAQDVGDAACLSPASTCQERGRLARRCAAHASSRGAGLFNGTEGTPSGPWRYRLAAVTTQSLWRGR